jgi:redox-sensitive bicupin YhaK (pirin superfamily)
VTAPTIILAMHALGPSPTPWPTIDPFLFCVHHLDAYPKGNGHMGPAASLAGRQMGQDFAGKDGWNMYHGQQVPGFPAHPHRGFETVTLARQGLIDHSDSLGAAARFGHGDVQWLTAGRGIVHAEMFPLLSDSAANPAELFQIWLNLPGRLKMAEPHFKMLWGDQVPSATVHDAEGRSTQLTAIAGRLQQGSTHLQPPAPPPDSWASQPGSGVAIWTLKMAPGAHWTLPAADTPGVRRMLYVFEGAGLQLAGKAVRSRVALELASGVAVDIVNGSAASECLLLQGKPIAEPVVSYGPFVMNTREEIEQTLRDYQKTEFGGWPWGDSAPVHGRAPQRFARQPDGSEERPQAALPAAHRGA